MRRFWAYIIIAFTALVSVIATTAVSVSRTVGNIEYMEGREIVFRITNKDSDQNYLEPTATDEVIEIMKSRLKASDITYYSIEKSDSSNVDNRKESYVKVQLRSDLGDISYSQVAFYLGFNGTLALSDNAEHYELFSDMMTDVATYEAYNQFYPALIIPIDNTPNSKFDQLFTTAKENATPETEEHEHEEGEETQEESAVYLYTWYDFNPNVDRYSKTQQTLSDGTTNPEYDENVASKLLNLKFKVTDDECFYPNGDKDKLFAVLDLGGTEENPATMDDAKSAFATARYIVNLLNAGSLDYKVEAINSSDMKIVNPLVESIKTQDQKLAWSRTFIATVCAVVILSLLIAVFYKLSAISICINTLMSVFLSFIVLLGLNAEFNTGAIIGLILVTLASLACGVLYANRLKEECYKGRTLKKANSEAARKTLFPIIDINLVIIVIGGFTFLFGGAIMRSFGLIAIIGGLISAAFNLLGLRGMMWLATNTTAFIGKYNLFGIDNKNVANHIEGEKQTYFGPYQDKDFTKKKKPFSIISGVIVLAAAVGLITFGSINNGQIFNSGNTANNSEVYFLANSRNAEDNPYRESNIKDILEGTYVFEGADSSKAKKLSEYVKNYKTDFASSVTEFTYVSKPDNSEGESEININYFYYIVKLNASLDAEKLNAYTMDGETPTASKPLNNVLKEQVEELNDTANSYVYLNNYAVVDTPSWGMMMLASFVASATLCVYFCLRYKLSRGLTSIFFPVISSITCLGIFSLLRIVTTSYISVGIPVVAAFTLIISIFFMEKEKEMVMENRAHDFTWAARNEIMLKSNSLAFTPILVFSILAIYLGINFFGFGAKATCSIYLLAILGMLFSAFLVTTLYGPVSSLFYKWFEKLAIKFNSNKPGKKNKANKRSAEPEEAVFIGIND